MSNLSTLAVCMSSITSVPLERINSVESFKTVFSQICDLLNAFNVHRLDVLSFRSHVFLQVVIFFSYRVAQYTIDKNWCITFYSLDFVFSASNFLWRASSKRPTRTISLAIQRYLIYAIVLIALNGTKVELIIHIVRTCNMQCIVMYELIKYSCFTEFANLLSWAAKNLGVLHLT